MTPAARVQAAIEIVDLVVEAARGNGPPADRIVADWFRTRRFAGSKDRRAVRELVYRAIRASGDVPPHGRAAMLRLAEDDETLAFLFDGSTHGPQPITPGEPIAAGGIAPPWLEARLADSGIEGDEARALIGRAPLDVRINPLRAGLADPPEGGSPLALTQGLRYPSGTRIEDSEAYRLGAIEVQDAGSQLACAMVGARPGDLAIDLCAGAGGKTLALAAAVGPQGKVVACDTDRQRLSRLGPRAERAGAWDWIETVLLDPGREVEALGAWQGKADAVIVDAPCSGTGTWRRNPEARWRLTAKQLDQYAALQARLLDIAATLVRPGGALTYVTCSLLDVEGARQADTFLARHPQWQAAPREIGAGTARGAGLRLSPGRDQTDGFFIARFGLL
ncbi:RNA methyltransferase [Novosphingobium sp. PC22D]|uniref:RsmB/NOP family class I SAM-dependent RNA methyltransferase n=1 Tax=Novosphingobium sp. PC22D TaxID=1962403 RepID=UPI000BEFAA31|nr:RsmB/NOP family class I SAM-dependent RNA methyltransferase [Novosphingobium sp. PC22D]PEQ13245.1 RNA methyltransferase [Novosphingobium sp. PC22D]